MLKTNFEKVSQTILKASQQVNKNVTLVAVSKTKSIDDIIEVYNVGQRVFGENYVQELIQKSNDQLILVKCPDIEWHFIGNIQSNKCKALTTIPNLKCIQSVGSIEIAKKLNSNFSSVNKEVNVFIQVNTSGENQKGGIELQEVVKMYESFPTQYPNLKLQGLMTIGAYGYDTSKGTNPDFQSLVNCRKSVSDSLGIPIDSIKLSMGMSSDYLQAIILGSDVVRVGSSIFGER